MSRLEFQHAPNLQCPRCGAHVTVRGYFTQTYNVKPEPEFKPRTELEFQLLEKLQFALLEVKRLKNRIHSSVPNGGS